MTIIIRKSTRCAVQTQASRLLLLVCFGLDARPPPLCWSDFASFLCGAFFPAASVASLWSFSGFGKIPGLCLVPCRMRVCRKYCGCSPLLRLAFRKCRKDSPLNEVPVAQPTEPSASSIQQNILHSTSPRNKYRSPVASSRPIQTRRSCEAEAICASACGNSLARSRAPLDLQRESRVEFRQP